MQDVIAQNPDIPRASRCCGEYLFDTYTISQAAAIRRLAETQERSASLAQLLEQMGAGNEAVTRTWWSQRPGDQLEPARRGKPAASTRWPASMPPSSRPSGP
jgi:hypothetical protein